MQETTQQDSTKYAAGEDTPLFLAGHCAPAGIYHLVGKNQEVRLDHDDILPATCDGHVAVYVRQPRTWSEIEMTRTSSNLANVFPLRHCALAQRR